MGNHRADAVVPTSRPVDSETPYIGRRRALPVEEAAVAPQPATPYVGKRRAVVAEPTGPIDPTGLIGRSGSTVEPAERRQSVAVAPDPVSTGQLQALLDHRFDETAPRPRVSGALLESRQQEQGVRTPIQRRADEAGSAQAAPTAPVVLTPAREQSKRDITVRPLFSDDSRLDIPVVGLPADIAGDQTIAIPLTMSSSVASHHGGRRRTAGSRSGRRRGLPSLPVLAGVASIAIAVTGVVTTTHVAMHPTAAHHLVQATALDGNTASASVGAGAMGPPRGLPLSRGGGADRSVQAAAQDRSKALDKTNQLADRWDDLKSKNLWVLPIELPYDYHLTGRFDDVSGLWATVHTGLDFACPTGTPIHAIADGTITFAEWDGPYGYKTVETLADGTEIWYAHQTEFKVSVGQTVRQGDVIGLVGSTGNTTGPHVHIEVRPGGGDPVDPDPAFKEHGMDVDAHQNGA